MTSLDNNFQIHAAIAKNIYQEVLDNFDKILNSGDIEHSLVNYKEYLEDIVEG